MSHRNVLKEHFYSLHRFEKTKENKNDTFFVYNVTMLTMFSLFLLPSVGHLPSCLSSTRHMIPLFPCVARFQCIHAASTKMMDKVGVRCSGVLISPLQQMGVGSELGRNRFWMGLCIIHADLMGLPHEHQAIPPEAELRIQSHYVMKAWPWETGSAGGSAVGNWQREPGHLVHS